MKRLLFMLLLAFGQVLCAQTTDQELENNPDSYREELP